jgi:hypothetical protein
VLKKEYTILMQHPESKLVVGVWKGTSQEDSFAWLESISTKEKFKGTVPVRSSRYLIMNKRINVSNAVLWLNIILLCVLIFKLVTL